MAGTTNRTRLATRTTSGPPVSAPVCPVRRTGAWLEGPGLALPTEREWMSQGLHPGAKGPLNRPIRVGARRQRGRNHVLASGPAMREARGLLPCSRRSERMSGRTGAKPPSASERVPGWFRSELQVAHIHSEPRADTGADRNHHHLVIHRRREPEASDHIG
jgi:hypothetical protein